LILRAKENHKSCRVATLDDKSPLNWVPLKMKLTEVLKKLYIPDHSPCGGEKRGKVRGVGVAALRCFKGSPNKNECVGSQLWSARGCV